MSVGPDNFDTVSSDRINFLRPDLRLNLLLGGAIVFPEYSRLTLTHRAGACSTKIERIVKSSVSIRPKDDYLPVFSSTQSSLGSNVGHEISKQTINRGFNTHSNRIIECTSVRLF